MNLDVSLEEKRIVNVYDRNITHNLTPMAKCAGIYKAIWRPEENGYTRASDLIEVLGGGKAFLIENADECKALSPENGWGNYDGFLDFVSHYLSACKKNPDAIIRVSR